MAQLTTLHPVYRPLLAREIERFGQYVRRRATADHRLLQRRHVRYERSWPLLVATLAPDGSITESSAALHDASQGGIGFLCDHTFRVDQLIFVRLFWYDSHALRIPAVVRHVSPIPAGQLTGAEYAIEDDQACELAFRLEAEGLAAIAAARD
jgi:hypothetical protein